MTLVDINKVIETIDGERMMEILDMRDLDGNVIDIEASQAVQSFYNQAIDAAIEAVKELKSETDETNRLS